jgi:hypothetical protein
LAGKGGKADSAEGEGMTDEGTVDEAVESAPGLSRLPVLDLAYLTTTGSGSSFRTRPRILTPAIALSQDSTDAYLMKAEL